MKPTVHWLGGWASSLSCWEAQLRELFPDFEHRFLDTHALLDKKPADAGLLFPDNGNTHHVVAGWSMGTLLAHHWIAQGLWPQDLPLLSLCPVFRFLRPGGFGEPILLKLEKKLISHREAVLRDFWRRMPKAGEIPAAWEENWIASARKYSDEELIQGLEFLKNTVVDTSALHATPRKWELLFGSDDQLAPDRGMETLPRGAVRMDYVGGHLPFWECPEWIDSSLKRLSGVATFPGSY